MRISEWWLEPHTQGPGAHAHPEDDVFYVIEGTMSFLVNDAWIDAYDCAVIVSNDSDLAEAMRLVRFHHPAKLLGLIYPRDHSSGHPSRELNRHAHFTKRVGKTLLAASQLPDPIAGTTIRKPAAW